MKENYFPLPAGELIQGLLEFFLLLKLYFIFNDNLFAGKMRKVTFDP